MANPTIPDGVQHHTYGDLPAAAQRVPRSTLLHTIFFKRISFPLTSRPDELWTVEVDHTGHETWSPLEEFLCRFCPLVDHHLLQAWATSWREHFDIPVPTDTTSQESQYPVLLQPSRKNQCGPPRVLDTRPQSHSSGLLGTFGSPFFTRRSFSFLTSACWLQPSSSWRSTFAIDPT